VSVRGWANKFASEFALQTPQILHSERIRMKGLTKRLLCCALGICAVVFAGCGSPWVKSLTAPLYKDEDAPDDTLTATEMNDEDFGIGIVPDRIFDVSDAGGWADALAGITVPGNYVINVTGNISVTNLPVWPAYTFGSISGITVSLRGGGSLAYTGSGYASLFTINTGQNLIIRDFTLQGDTDNGWTLLEVYSGGTATLKTGGKIIGNIAGATVGGGVFVSGGTFTMEGGEISGNTSTGGSGGGVYVGPGGIFTMSGGEIKDNTSSTGQGGGVYVDGSATLFDKTGGTIYGGSDSPPNTASGGLPGSGQAVYTGAESGRYRDDTVSDTDNISVSGGNCVGDWYPPPI
jgi:hypothetical protein